MWENNFKSFFDHNLRLIFEIFEKKKCDFMCYTWYETIQHWHHWHCCWWQKVLDPRLVLQKISQYCPETRNLRVSTVRYTASSWRHIKFSKICLLFCFSTGSKYYDPNFWLLWKFILRHNSLKNYCKMILNKRKFAYLSKKWFCICKNGGVVLYTQSLYYKGFRFYGHFKIFPINLINASTADHLFLASTTNLCCPWIYSF